MTKTKLTKYVIAAATFAAFVTPVLARSYADPAAGVAASTLITLMTCCFGFFALALPMIFIAGYILNIVCIFDAIQRDFGDDNNQLILWIFVLLFAGFPVGTLLYYYLAVKKYPKKK